MRSGASSRWHPFRHAMIAAALGMCACQTDDSPAEGGTGGADAGAAGNPAGNGGAGAGGSGSPGGSGAGGSAAGAGGSAAGAGGGTAGSGGNTAGASTGGSGGTVAGSGGTPIACDCNPTDLCIGCESSPGNIRGLCVTRPSGCNPPTCACTEDLCETVGCAARQCVVTNTGMLACLGG